MTRNEQIAMFIGWGWGNHGAELSTTELSLFNRLFHWYGPPGERPAVKRLPKYDNLTRIKDTILATDNELTEVDLLTLELIAWMQA